MLKRSAVVIRKRCIAMIHSCEYRSHTKDAPFETIDYKLEISIKHDKNVPPDRG